MLKSLSIENIAVIEKAEIEFTSGLNVLTGETGAGKSIVVDSINAILGERTSKELVRHNSDNACVTAVFEDISEEVKAKLIKLDLPYDDSCLLLSRRITAQGKSYCRVNGAPCTVSMLKEIGSGLVNIHGQHDSQALLNPEYHYKFVDMYSDNQPLLNEYYTLFKKLLAARRRLKELTADADNKDKQLELLDYQIDELSQADIQIGEIEQLKARKTLVTNAQSIVTALNAVLSALNGDDDFSGIQTLISTAVKDFSDVSGLDNELKEIYDHLEALSEAGVIIKDLVSDKLSDIDFSETELESIEERLDLYYNFSNKYGKTEEDMINYLEDAVKKRDSIVNSDEELEILNHEYDEIFEKTVSLAEKLSDDRKSASKKLEQDIKEQLEFLDMPKIEFVVSFEKGNLSAVGYDKIEFLISTNPGEPPKPLSKIASGGELSRIMLAIKNIIAKNDTIDTLIFDEVDTGVSGRASRKIGLKLKSVGSMTQVICVTHSAQIASLADSHYLIEKKIRDNSTYTSVKLLDYDGRKKELARIMGGFDITENMLRSAEELLNENETMEDIF